MSWNSENKDDTPGEGSIIKCEYMLIMWIFSDE